MSIKSPCIQVCTIDKQSNLCYGCARSMAEIQGWSKMDATKRDKIMGEIDHRMLVHFGVDRSKRSAS